MQDIRNALRALRAAPLVSLVAVCSLALGIGANTAMFSIVDKLVLRTLPVPEPERLAVIGDDEGDPSSWTNPIWEAIRDRADLFAGAAAYSSTRFNLSASGEAEYVDGLWASGRFFEVLGAGAVLGRTFDASDDRRGGGDGGPVAVISYDYWQRRYGGAADVIGRTISLNRTAYTIVGVTGPEFYGAEVGRAFEVAVPIGTEPVMRGTDDSWLDRRSTWWLEIMVRLEADQGVGAATAALAAVTPQIRDETLPTHWRADDQANYLKGGFTVVPAAGGVSSLRSRYQRPLLTIMVVVGLVLLIACGNIANLLLARATARRHEMSVRQALGASRRQLARQLLLESLLLSTSGAVLGGLIALWGSRLLVYQLSTATSTVSLDLGPDWRLFLFTALLAVGTALLFGTAPALRAARTQPIEAIKEQGRSVGERTGGGLGHGLVVAQVALSLVLVVAASLFVGTFARLATVDRGFDESRMLIARVAADRAGVEAGELPRFYDRIAEAVERVPGVASVGWSVLTPLSRSMWNERIEVRDGIELPERERLSYLNLISPTWLETFGTPVLLGRGITADDRAESPRVVLVNETFVRTFIGTGDPLGRVVVRRAPGGEGTIANEIVGVVKDAVYQTLRAQVPPTMYLPGAQEGIPTSVSLSVRAERGSPMLLAQPIARAVTGVSGDLSLSFRTLDDDISASLAQERLVAILSGFFGGLALLLAALGLYGVTAYSVNRRRAEIGIRMALGAGPGRVLGLVLRRVGAQVVAGVAIGALLSWWGSRFVGKLLYGLEPTDPVVFVGSALVLGAIGGLAGWLPARRAARFDPSEVLREA
ncbi:MAG: ABC transporter permease [Gemmatimonadales bacterium]